MAGYYIHPAFREGDSPLAGVSFVEDFLQGPAASATDDAASFDLVGTSAGLTLSDSLLNGVGVLLSNSTNPAGLVGNGEPFALADRKTIYYEARVSLADADGMSFFTGLAITSANPFSGSLTDYVGFFTTDGNIKIGCGKNNNNVPGSGTSGETDTDTGLDFADNTMVRLGFAVSGTDEVRFYVDGVYVGKITTDLPDDENLTPTLFTVGSAETVNVDYIAALAPRA
jgi:hypothetical protein